MLYNIGTKTEDTLYNQIDGEELLSKLEKYFNKQDIALKTKIKLYIKSPVNFYKLSTYLNIHERELIILLHVIFPDIFSKRMITALSKIYLKPEFDKTKVLEHIDNEMMIKENKMIILKLEHLKSRCKKVITKIKKIKNKNYKFKTRKEKEELMHMVTVCNDMLKVFKEINNKSVRTASLNKLIDMLKTYNKKNKMS